MTAAPTVFAISCAKYSGAHRGDTPACRSDCPCDANACILQHQGLVAEPKQRPILMSGELVAQTLAGIKTQTRRPLRFQPPAAFYALTGCTTHVREDGSRWDGWYWSLGRNDASQEFWPSFTESLFCPYGQVGDRLWVRETWQHSNWPDGPYDDGCDVFYRVDYMNDVHGLDGERSPEGRYRFWKPSIHMPRSASRIDLRIGAVRPERLNDISEADAAAEGAPKMLTPLSDVASHRAGFAHLWETIYGAGSWSLNPWVWVVDFEVIKRERV